MSEFDWHDPDEDSVVVRPRPGLAVYRNCRAEVVIRQMSGDDYDEDLFVYVAPEHATAIAQAVLREVGLEATAFRELTQSDEPLLQLPSPRVTASGDDGKGSQVEMRLT